MCKFGQLKLRLRVRLRDKNQPRNLKKEVIDDKMLNNKLKFDFLNYNLQIQNLQVEEF